jgi:hypothetical protein
MSASNDPSHLVQYPVEERKAFMGGELVLRYIAGAIIGAAVGGLIGYFGKCVGLG